MRSKHGPARVRGGTVSSVVGVGGGTAGRGDGGGTGGGGGRLMLAEGADGTACGGEEGGEGEGLGMAWGSRGPGHPGQRPRDEPLTSRGRGTLRTVQARRARAGAARRSRNLGGAAIGWGGTGVAAVVLRLGQG